MRFSRNRTRMTAETFLSRGYRAEPSFATVAYWVGYIDPSDSFHFLGPTFSYVPWSKVAIFGMVIPPLIGILTMGV